jgi:hypothetical protein
VIFYYLNKLPDEDFAAEIDLSIRRNRRTGLGDDESSFNIISFPVIRTGRQDSE